MIKNSHFAQIYFKAPKNDPNPLGITYRLEYQLVNTGAPKNVPSQKIRLGSPINCNIDWLGKVVPRHPGRIQPNTYARAQEG